MAQKSTHKTQTELALDQEARRLAQQEFVRPLLLEAGAGTGKTATLVNRILAWSLEPGWKLARARLEQRPADSLDSRSIAQRTATLVLRGLVAITFTEAAADEMANRVFRGLKRVGSGDAPVGFDPPYTIERHHRERAAALLGCSEQLQVRTIHAYCRKLLAEHPFEANLHPTFTVDAETTVTQEIVEEVVIRNLAAAYDEPGSADFLMLAQRGYGPREIAEVLAELAIQGVTSAELEEALFAPETFQQLLLDWTDTINRLQTLLEVRRSGLRRAKNAVKIITGLGRLKQRLALFVESPPPPSKIRQWLDRYLPSSLIQHLKIWAGKKTANQEEQEHLQPIIHPLATLSGEFVNLERHLRALDPEFLDGAIRVLSVLMKQVRSEMRRRGVLNFVDLLVGARDLLRDCPEVRQQVRRRLDQLLVDEFQDTDALQCDLIRDLAFGREGGKNPGLFVVGDPKQSIYGWRNADLEAYEGFAKSLALAGGLRRPLVVNFRSAPEILQEVERVIAPLMRGRAGLQPEFQPLHACEGRQDSAFVSNLSETSVRQRSPIEYWISWICEEGDPSKPVEGNASQTAEIEAQALATDLVELHHKEGVPWRDMAILLRSFSDLEVYLSSFREAGVPFQVSRDRQYYRRREIIDASALVRTIFSPDDQIALVTFIRSSIVGVPDAALIPLWSQKFPWHLSTLQPGRPTTDGDEGFRQKLDAAVDAVYRARAEMGDHLPSNSTAGPSNLENWHLNLDFAVRCIADFRRRIYTDPPDRFVDRIRRLTLFEGCESARFLGAHRLANLERFFSDLYAQLEQCAGDYHRVVRRLKSLVGQGTEAEEAQLDETGEDKIRVLTVHQSKGLEFGHVYLPQMHKESGKQPNPALVGRCQGQLEVLLFSVPSIGFYRLEQRRLAKERAELIRTLYVAMTRAERRLVLIGRPSLAPVGHKPLERPKTYTQILTHRRGDSPSTADLLSSFKEGTPPTITDGEVTWFLAARSNPNTQSRSAHSAIMWPSLRQIQSDQRHLEHLRVQAAQRMAVPTRRTITLQALESSNRFDAVEVPGIIQERMFPQELNLESSPERLDKVSAKLIGQLYHHILETFDFTAADSTAEEARQRAKALDFLCSIAPEHDTTPLLKIADSLLQKLFQGHIFNYFKGLGKQIVARELEVLLPLNQAQKHGLVRGVVDLVYVDSDGRWTVADYKTNSADRPELSQTQFTQATLYAAAIHRGLGLETRPAVEIWYLHQDKIVRR